MLLSAIAQVERGCEAEGRKENRQSTASRAKVDIFLSAVSCHIFQLEKLALSNSSSAILHRFPRCKAWTSSSFLRIFRMEGGICYSGGGSLAARNFVLLSRRAVCGQLHRHCLDTHHRLSAMKKENTESLSCCHANHLSHLNRTSRPQRAAAVVVGERFQLACS